MPPIRVLCVFSTLDRGGAESMCMNLYRHIDREKVQLDFVKHTGARGAFEDEIEELGGKVYEAPRYKLINHISYVRWWHTFLRNHPEYKILHGHFFTISSVYLGVAKKENRYAIGHSHCTETTKEQIERPIVHLISNYLIRHIEDNVDYSMACSTEAGEWVFKTKPFIVLNNAIDSEMFRANPIVSRRVREEFNMGNKLILGNVSRFNIQKNPYGILEIFKEVHKKRPESMMLWVGDGPMRKEIEEKAKFENLNDSIIFTGVRSDVERLLQAMDAFIMPSFFEGLPVSAIEAQAAGVQCFVSDTVSKETSITELYHPLPINNISTWAEEIAKLEAGYIHPNMQRQIIEAGFDINETAKWLESFYLKMHRQYRGVR